MKRQRRSAYDLTGDDVDIDEDVVEDEPRQRRRRLDDEVPSIDETRRRIREQCAAFGRESMDAIVAEARLVPTIRPIYDYDSYPPDKADEFKRDLCAQLATHYVLGQISVELHADMYVDPITKELLTDPVMTSGDGETYNRSTIPRFNDKSPMNRRPLGTVTPNMAARRIMEPYLRTLGLRLSDLPRQEPVTSAAVPTLATPPPQAASPDSNADAYLEGRLVQAAASGDVDEVRSISRGTRPSAMNAALIMAAFRGRAAVVGTLLTLPGVDPAAQDNFAIEVAIGSRHGDVVRILLADPRVRSRLSDDAVARASAAIAASARRSWWGLGGGDAT